MLKKQKQSVLLSDPKPFIFIGGNLIEYVNKVVNLGFDLTCDLEWDSQVSQK